MNTHKTCSTCKLLLPVELFNKNKRQKDGLARDCKSCCSEYNKKYYAENKEKVTAKNREAYQNNKEQRSKDGKEYYHKNKEVILTRAKEYKKNNKEKLSTANKKYAENNKEKIKNYQQEYHKNNKEKIRKTSNEYEIRRSNEDPAFNLRKTVSAQIRIFLRSKNVSKNNESILDYLPYTIQQLRDHLESLFEDWMTWDNWGMYKKDSWDDTDPSTWRWSLDHIVVQADLPYTSMEDENFKKCWALSNLRPYSAKQNVIDGSTKVRHKKKNST